MEFYIEQEVECINADESLDLLTVGAKYTIIGFGLDAKELPTLYTTNAPYPGWYISRFHALTSRPTSISIFIAMLGPRQKETVDG